MLFSHLFTQGWSSGSRKWQTFDDCQERHFVQNETMMQPCLHLSHSERREAECPRPPRRHYSFTLCIVIDIGLYCLIAIVTLNQVFPFINLFLHSPLLELMHYTHGSPIPLQRAAFPPCRQETCQQELSARRARYCVAVRRYRNNS